MRFKCSASYAGDGQKVEIRMEEYAHHLVQKNVLAFLNTAREWVRECITQCGQDPLSTLVVKEVKRCFLLDLPSDDDPFFIVKSNLQLISHGLAQNQVFKIGDKISSTGQAYGSTPLDYDKPAEKDHHNTYTDRQWGREGRYGAIKLRTALFEGKGMTAYGPITLIHEASHKYAGTWDYHYFDLCGNPPSEEFTDKGSAIFNADSYAWFASAVNKKNT
jgi:hypothetical protein